MVQIRKPRKRRPLSHVVFLYILMPSFDTKSIAMLFRHQGTIPTILRQQSSPSEGIATQAHAIPMQILIRLGRTISVRQPLAQLVEKPVSLLVVCIHAAPPFFLPAHARGAARHFCTSSYIFISSPLSRPRLRSVRVLGARSSSNLRLRNISCRQLSLRLHMCADRVGDTFRGVCREANSFEGILRLLA